MVKLKICGLRRLEDVEIVNKYKPDYIGFVFAKSKRQITLEQGKLLKEALDTSVQAVGVFVNEEIENICQYAHEKVMDCIQLHGDEDGEYIKSLKQKVNLPIIKAIHVSYKEELINKLQEVKALPIDYYLFDTYIPKQYGGSGQHFDWQMIDDIATQHIKRPYFLAGGIGYDNLKEVVKHKPYAIDISSKVEIDGFKDEAKIKEIIAVLQAI